VKFVIHWADAASKPKKIISTLTLIKHLSFSMSAANSITDDADILSNALNKSFMAYFLFILFTLKRQSRQI